MQAQQQTTGQIPVSGHGRPRYAQIAASVWRCQCLPHRRLVAAESDWRDSTDVQSLCEDGLGMQCRAHYYDECMAPNAHQQYTGDSDQRHRTNRCLELCSARMVAWRTRAGAFHQHSQWRRCLVERSLGAKSPRSFITRKLRLDPRISGEILHLQRAPEVLVDTSQSSSSAVHEL